MKFSRLLLSLLLASTVSAAIPPISTYDADARLWAKSTIPAVTNTVTDLQYTVANELLNFMRSRGIRSKVNRMHMYMGSGLQSMRAPVIADLTSGVIIYDSINNFVDGDFTESGLTGNGTTKFLLTSIYLNSFGAITNHHVAVYNRTSGTLNTTFETGVGQVGVALSQIAVSYTGLGTFFQAGSGATYCNVADASGVGCYLGTVTSTTAAAIYKNGAVHCSWADPGGTTGPNVQVAVHARNLGGVFDSYSSRQLCWYSVGLGISPQLADHYYRGVQFAQRRLGRAL